MYNFTNSELLEHAYSVSHLNGTDKESVLSKEVIRRDLLKYKTNKQLYKIDSWLTKSQQTKLHYAICGDAHKFEDKNALWDWFCELAEVDHFSELGEKVRNFTKYHLAIGIFALKPDLNICGIGSTLD